MSDPYKILGVEHGSSEDEVKKAYKTLARKYHPDKGGTAEKFREISEAYTQITKGSDPMNEFPELSEIFKMFGSMAGLESMIGGSAFGGFGSIASQFIRGPTISTSVNLTLEQLELGGSFKLKYNRRVPTGKYNQITTQSPLGNLVMMSPEEIDMFLLFLRI